MVHAAYRRRALFRWFRIPFLSQIVCLARNIPGGCREGEAAGKPLAAVPGCTQQEVAGQMGSAPRPVRSQRRLDLVEAGASGSGPRIEGLSAARVGVTVRQSLRETPLD